MLTAAAPTSPPRPGPRGGAVAHPRLPAAAGRGEPLPLIDLVFHELESAWAMEVIRAVENVARDAGLSVVLSESAGRLTPGRTWADQVAARRPHGVILVLSGLDESQRALLTSRSIPFVVVDPAGDPGADVPSIGATQPAGRTRRHPAPGRPRPHPDRRDQRAHPDDVQPRPRRRLPGRPGDGRAARRPGPRS
ncbi:hypothetical protein LV779_22830 [Streptomyces thinghirensis]|nr:hypothetical protein [Streptomyces thinghirensis]